MWEEIALAHTPVENGGTRAMKHSLALAAQRGREMRETKPVSIRINKQNLDKLQQRARHEGISYQTLINSLIHRHVRETPRANYSTTL